MVRGASSVIRGEGKLMKDGASATAARTKMGTTVGVASRGFCKEAGNG